MSESIIVERDGGIVRVTLNRPEKLNAINAEMADAVRDVFLAAASDDTARVVVLAAAGRAFCAGQDLADPAVLPGSDLGAMVEAHYNPLIRAIRALRKPVIAAVNGVAAGAGANLALAADIVIAARSATFIESFARIGLVPDSGGTWMLPRLIGYARAVGLTLLAQPMTAPQALEWGAIWNVVDDEALRAECDKLAVTLSSAPTLGLGEIKRALNVSWTNDLDAQLDLERDLQRKLGASNDYGEGVEAFRNKRAPNFGGR